jgi:hypothetical protein
LLVGTHEAAKRAGLWLSFSVENHEKPDGRAKGVQDGLLH